MGTAGVIHIPMLEVKFLDHRKTNFCESTSQECLRLSRYRRSPYRKRCRFGIRSLISFADPLGTSPANEKSKSVGSGGSTSARLKPKGTDGMALQGVEYAAQFDSTRGILPGQDGVWIDRLRALS
jgi:hypothetical protein